MKKIIVLFLLFSMFTNSQNIEYDVTIEENGNALVAIVLNGNLTTSLPLPIDVSQPYIEGALFTITDEGLDLVVDDQGIIAYKTSLLTEKSLGVWIFQMDLIKEKSSISVSLPKNAKVSETNPKSGISLTEDSVNVNFIDKAIKDDVEIKYIFDKESSSSSTIKKNEEKLGVADGSNNNLLIYVLILLLIGSIYILLNRRKNTEGTLSDGMDKIMRTLTGNEYKIVDTLIRNKMGMRRNILEKESGLAKSSLSLGLRNLKRKNILDIDDKDTVHYVELTNWFKNL